MNALQKEAEQLTRSLVLTDDQLHQIQSLLMNSFNDGLKRETNPVAPVKMFPTFVKEVPDAKHKYGKFLALDLGGTNFRVLLIELLGDELHHETEIYTIADELRNGTGAELFDYIAFCIFSFMNARNLVQFRMPLGFTFSFPCIQEGLSSARLTTWTKGF
ncbi:PREDICTED: hexokinase-2-like, partial [Rhagoletis zephyria]|uniref:hexokinase-2-like n=1 Tax=Rhagoletis zephyria TaxID=28612 RepID=UPI00081169ED